MTRYQLELRRPDGTWTPHGPPARSMTAATLIGLRIDPPVDMRVVQVESPDPMIAEIERAKRTVMEGHPDPTFAIVPSELGDTFSDIFATQEDTHG